MCKTLWEFETENFRVTCSAEDEDMPPEDVFQFQDDIDAVRNGRVDYFMAVVEIECKNTGHTIGRDTLGACTEKSASDFVAGHRDADPMNRNCSIMRGEICRECHGIGETFPCVTCKHCKGYETRHNVVICHYFPSMVSQAIADARATLNSLH